MRIQKQLSRKSDNKIYYKYVVILPPDYVKESGLEGCELKAEISKGEIRLKKKNQKL